MFLHFWLRSQVVRYQDIRPVVDPFRIAVIIVCRCCRHLQLMALQLFTSFRHLLLSQFLHFPSARVCESPKLSQPRGTQRRRNGNPLFSYAIFTTLARHSVVSFWLSTTLSKNPDRHKPNIHLYSHNTIYNFFKAICSIWLHYGLSVFTQMCLEYMNIAFHLHTNSIKSASLISL